MSWLNGVLAAIGFFLISTFGGQQTPFVPSPLQPTRPPIHIVAATGTISVGAQENLTGATSPIIHATTVSPAATTSSVVRAKAQQTTNVKTDSTTSTDETGSISLNNADPNTAMMNPGVMMKVGVTREIFRTDRCQEFSSPLFVTLNYIGTSSASLIVGLDTALSGVPPEDQTTINLAAVGDLKMKDQPFGIVARLNSIQGGTAMIGLAIFPTFCTP